MSTPNFARVHDYILDLMKKVKVPAKGLFDYPTPTTTASDFYSACIFTWDTHHITLRYAIENEPEMMKYFLLTMLKFQSSNGYISCCVSSTNGASYSHSFHAQPYLAQNAAEYAAKTGDFETIRGIYDKLSAYLNYWFSSSRAPFGLFRWNEVWMSGFDNEITGTIFQPGTILPPDLPSLLYLECRAMAYLGRKLGRPEAAGFDQKAEDIRKAVNDLLWDEGMDTYTAYNLETGAHQTSLRDEYLSSEVGRYAYVSCPSLLTLFSGIATPERAERMIRRYVLAPEHFRSKFGIRSLSKSSEYYNNGRWGNPPRFGDHKRLTNSNWQGPVWIPLGWFVFHGLLRYGFRKEAEALADDTVDLVAKALDTLGFMRENFNAETGEPLYADYFGSWNMLADTMHLYLTDKNPLQLFPWEQE